MCIQHCVGARYAVVGNSTAAGDEARQARLLNRCAESLARAHTLSVSVKRDARRFFAKKRATLAEDDSGESQHDEKITVVFYSTAADEPPEKFACSLCDYTTITVRAINLHVQ